MTVLIGTRGTQSWAKPLVLVLLCSISPVLSEIREFNGKIAADSSYIHFSEGFLVAPGYVDLSDLMFTTKDYDARPPWFPTPHTKDDKKHEDANEQDHEKSAHEPQDDDIASEIANDPASAPTDGGGRYLAETPESLGTMMDIVLFHEDDECSKNRNGCDWTKLGVGASDGHGNLRWCCSGDAVDFGFCEGGANQNGRLIVNTTLFTGQHRVINIPSTGHMETSVKYGKLEQPEHNGKYVLVIANCDDNGRDVYVSGDYTWKSKHGYLPGDLFGEMYFLAALTILYTALLLWYGISMKCYEDSIIPIQKWVLVTIGMGLLESFFKAGDLFVYNEDGTRFWFALYTGVVIGVLKRAISRCLVLMVSLGWGVVRDTLGDRMKRIVFLGILYAIMSCIRDVATLFAVTENQILSINEEKKLFDLVTILTFAVAVIDVIFYLWILEALNGTMEYLENMSQSSKLKRYLRLRCLLLLSILFAVIWAVFSLVNTYMDESMLEPSQEWTLDASWDINYLFVLCGVALLWRPNPTAREYAYVVELPALGDDVEFESNANAIPHPDDDDDEDYIGTPKDGYKDDANGEETFKIDGAVDA